MSAAGVAGRAWGSAGGLREELQGQAGAAAGDWRVRVPGPRAAGPRPAPGSGASLAPPSFFRLWLSAWGGNLPVPGFP